MNLNLNPSDKKNNRAILQTEVLCFKLKSIRFKFGNDLYSRQKQGPCKKALPEKLLLFLVDLRALSGPNLRQLVYCNWLLLDFHLCLPRELLQITKTQNKLYSTECLILAKRPDPGHSAGKEFVFEKLIPKVNFFVEQTKIID